MPIYNVYSSSGNTYLGKVKSNNKESAIKAAKEYFGKRFGFVIESKKGEGLKPRKNPSSYYYVGYETPMGAVRLTRVSSLAEAKLVAKEFRMVGRKGVRVRKNPTRKVRVITKRNIGKYFEGFGYVLARDVGKKYYIKDGSYFVENDAQMIARTKKNPAASRLASGAWVPAHAVRIRGGKLELMTERSR